MLDGLSPPRRASSGSWSAGSEAQGKAQAAVRSIREATGEGRTGRVKNLNLRLMSRYRQLRRWDAVAEHKDCPLGSPPSREGRAPPSSGHRRHPPRSYLVRAKRGNPRRGPALVGRSADREEGPTPRRESDDREANAGSRKTTGNRDAMAGPFSRPVPHHLPDTGLCSHAKAC